MTDITPDMEREYNELVKQLGEYENNEEPINEIPDHIKGGMPTYLKKAVNETKPGTIELTPKEKILDKSRNVAAKTGDVVLGTMVGDAIGGKFLGKFNKKIENTIKELNGKTNEFWTKFPWLTDGLPKVREMKESMGIKPLSTQEMISKITSMTPEEKAAAKIAEKNYMDNRLKITELGKKQKNVNKVAGKTTPLAGSTLGFIFSPINSLKDEQDKYLIRKAKENVLFKLFAYPGKNFNPSKVKNMSQMKDEELDQLFNENIEDIISLFQE